MKTYEIAPFGSYLWTAAISLAVGLPFVVISVLWALGFATVNGKSQAFGTDLLMAALFTLAGVASLYICWRCLTRIPYRVMVAGDGSIELARIIGSVTIRPADIAAIDRFGPRLDADDQDARKLRITYAGGFATVPYFDGVEELIAGAKSRNPGIIVRGEWPA